MRALRLDNGCANSCYADDVRNSKVPTEKNSSFIGFPIAMISFNQGFVFQSPTAINFGVDTASGIADYVVQYGGSKVLLVTDKGLVQHNVVQPLIQALTEGGMSPVVFDDVPPDSDLDCVNRAVEIGRREGCDAVLAVGGGSVIDTAKAVNIGLCNEGDLRDFEGINCLSERLKPLIVIPTTAGTGSEVSAVAMIRDLQNGKKLLYGSRYLYADMALLDPRLLVSLPPKLTAATGLDALTHCLESYVSSTANSLSDALALEAGTMLFAYLPRATSHGEDIDARSATLIASCMAGVAFTNAGVGVVHALAHTIGGKFGTHHGLTNAILLPHGMRLNMPVAANRYAKFWRHLASSGMFSDIGYESFVSTNEPDDQQAANLLLNAVEELMKLCNLPGRLKDIGVPTLGQEELFELAEISMTDPAIMFNPGEVNTDDLVKILTEAF